MSLPMKTIEVLENNVRGVVHESIDAARKYVKENPLTPEYVFEMLFERGVLEVLEDGKVTGKVRAKPVQVEGVSHNTSADYKAHWPRATVLLDILNDGPIKLRALQEKLKARGEVGSHWLTLHALWHLEKKGTVVSDKRTKKYQLVGWVAPVGGAPVEKAENDEEDNRLTPSQLDLRKIYHAMKEVVEKHNLSGGMAIIAKSRELCMPEVDLNTYQTAASDLVEEGNVQYNPVTRQYSFVREPGAPEVEEVE